MTRFFYWSFLFTSVCFSSFAQKDGRPKICSDKTLLMYQVNFESEEYLFEVRIEQVDKEILFNYRIVGGSKIRSGVYKSFAFTDETYKELGLAIPGSSTSGNFEPYILVSNPVVKKLAALKLNHDSQYEIAVNGKKYRVTRNGMDGYSFGESTIEFVNAQYFSISNGVENGSLVLGMDFNKQIILRLSLDDIFTMQLVKITSFADESRKQ